MPDQEIRQYLIDNLKTVPGIGKIYDYDRYPALNETAAFLRLFQDETTTLIMGWELTRIAVTPIVRVANDAYKVSHTYQLKGYYSLRDKERSEVVFNAIVDAVVQRMVDIEIPNEQGLHIPRVPIIAAKQFGNVLCHYAQIEWTVSEVITKTAAAMDDVLKLLLTAYLADAQAIMDQAEI